MAKAKKRKGKVILPTKMSALIKLALKDIRKMERTKNVIIDMSTFFEPKSEVACMTDSGLVVEKYKVCILCAAGAVMAGTLGADINGRPLSPESFKGNDVQLRAIDCLRSGEVRGAAVTLDLLKDDLPGASWQDYSVKFDVFNVGIPDYEPLDPEPFHKAMGKLQAKLEKAGY